MVFFAVAFGGGGMRILAFDGRMGASGDMLLGALLAAGADRGVLTPIEESLDLEYVVDEVMRHGIAATRVDVQRDGELLEGHGPHRSFAEVREQVMALPLSDTVRSTAVETFRLLGMAEARVHDTDLESTHFHEVGADDAIADIVGVARLLADLAPDKVMTTPVAVGDGEVEMSHGTYPVPPPAVVELAGDADWEIRGGPVSEELLTPTGAALLAQIADGVMALPPVKVESSGYGAGRLEVDERPNVLRALVGESQALVADELAVLETNIDDASPEVLGGLQDSLSAVGARDVTILPATMKKSRPGHLVKVVTTPEDAHQVARRLATETGSLGVRQTSATHRWIAEREIQTVQVEIGGVTYAIDVKVATDAGGDEIDVSAEYDDAAAVAAEIDRPVREVMRKAEAAFRERNSMS